MHSYCVAIFDWFLCSFRPPRSFCSFSSFKGLSPKEVWDVVGIDCKKGVITDIKEQVPKLMVECWTSVHM